MRVSGMATAGEVLAFWRAAGAERWFTRDPAFDALCRERFLSTWQAAATGELDHWQADPEGALALVIVLDQLPRNMFHGTPEAYVTDAAALRVAERAVGQGFDAQVEPELRQFFAMPFMHSERLSDQDRSIALLEAAQKPDNLKWARHHRDIVARFGRFPHRNAILGRETTAEEAAFLETDPFRG